MNVDRYGFPVRECTRCGGCGQYSFNPMHGTVCFKCSGTGLQHSTKRVRDAYAEFNAARRAAVRPTLAGVEAGDQITFDLTYNGIRSDADFQTVAAITVTPKRCGSSLIGTDESQRVYHYEHAVSFTDGSHRVTSGNVIVGRRGVKVDPAPFVAKATGRK